MITINSLKAGDEIRIVAPSRSLAAMNTDIFNKAVNFLEGKGFIVSISKNSYERDESHSSSIESRVEDLHEAFLDSKVKAIMACNGGSNVNQILEYLDYELIKRHPKAICGFSDIAALLNAIHAKTGLITYHGPLLAFLGYDDAIDNIDYTFSYFEKCLMQSGSYPIEPSNQAVAYQVIQEGSCQGELMGGNLCTLNLLQGTEFMPDFENKILLLEDSNSMGDYFAAEFDRNLQSLIQTRGFEGVKGLIFGRFEDSCKMDAAAISRMVKTKKQLANLPIVANVNFGHELPFATFPIGGVVKVEAFGTSVSLEIIKN